MAFELSNEQRQYFGLDPVMTDWEMVPIKPGFPIEGYLYFKGDVIKKRIISVDFRYSELQYDERTQDRATLVPKTAKGQEKRLSGATLGQRTPRGVYLEASSHGVIHIANHTSQTTFYSSRWDTQELVEEKNIVEVISDFVAQSPPDHLTQIAEFKDSKRRHIHFRSGDYFSFKISRTHFGFGRVLLDVGKLRKSGVIPRNHGLSIIMGPPVLVQIFGIASCDPDIEISKLADAPKLPSDFMMDNLLFYGEYKIIGHKELVEADFEFPISYGKSVDGRPVVFLQWGLIHLELPLSTFNKFLVETNTRVPENSGSRNITNPFGYYSIGFRPSFDASDIFRTAENNGVYSFAENRYYKAVFDLRNPFQRSKQREILKAFGLDPDLTYQENCKKTGTITATELIKGLS